MNRKNWLSLAYLVLIYGFLFIPAVVVVLFSFNDSQFWSFPLKGLTLRWYIQLLERPDAITALWNSIIVAVPTMIFAVLIGGGVAVAFHQWQARLAGVAEGVMLLPQLIPTLIWGLGLLLLMTALQAPMGAPTIIVAHLLYTTPYVFLLVRSRYATLDDNLERAARGLGSTPLHAFRRVVLPHLAPSLVAGGLLAFAVSFSDLVLAYLLSGNGFNTLPVFIYSLIQYEPSSMINAVASVVFIVAISSMLGALFFVGKDAVLIGEEKPRA